MNGRSSRAATYAVLASALAAGCGFGGSSGGAPLFDPPNDGPVDTVILIMGDGMGREHVRSGGIYKHGEPGSLCFEPNGTCFDGEPSEFTRAEVSTFSDSTILTEPDLTATDSAAAATALSTGRKAANNALARTAWGERMLTILELAQSLGKSTGIVTTSYILDASPAAFAAHVRDRGNRDKIICDYLEATQPTVIMGGGRTQWNALDGDRRAADVGYTVIETASELRTRLATGGIDAVAGLETGLGGRGIVGVFPASPAPYPPDSRFGCLQNRGASAGQLADGLSVQLDREINQCDPDEPGKPCREFPDPTLVEMTQAALDLLEENANGFFLFVENEQTDTLNHYFGVPLPDSCASGLHLADPRVPYVQEMVAREVGVIDEVVETVVGWVERTGRAGRTLVLVTADHECCGLSPDRCESASRPGATVPCCFDPFNVTLENPDLADGTPTQCCRDADGALAPCKPWHTFNPDARRSNFGETRCRRYDRVPGTQQVLGVESPVACEEPGDVILAAPKYPFPAATAHTSDPVDVYAYGSPVVTSALEDLRTNSDVYYLMQYALTGSFIHVTPPEEYPVTACDALPDEPPGL